ncbi:LD-carboxypeptidase [Leucobacter coleopterorum]|uniref:LD-carboxypeptidase n=1 Tax=Leucobacter coleopterorum TaxID=2714933 RepID=A0ABX6JXI3_9MICO|nr:LD-carboxypeptidase [Leucobacter coleopterorum]QIM19026.1 LD-carboxypeptidase [Leucobacter coleopterorum]
MSAAHTAGDHPHGSPGLRPLQVGDRVGLVTPSSAVPADRMREAIALVESWGLVPVVGEHALDTHPRAGSYLAGSDEQRAADLMRAYTDDSLAAVFCMRGGYGAVRLLDLLDVGALRAARPKPLIGSSDITALHEFWERELGVATWFAPMLGTGELMDDPRNITALKRSLFLPTRGKTLSAPGADTMVQGVGEGTLTGGNLSLLAMTTGSRPGGRSAKGRIVLIEDVSEQTYRIDGFLVNLLRSGYFEGAAGIVLGTWHECSPLPEIRALAEELLVPLGIPLVWGLPFGHGFGVDCVPLGVQAKLVADAQQPRLEVLG